MISRVVALPSNPNEHEPLDREPGTQQGTHEGWAIILLMLNLVLELMIWIPANSHKRLARIGIPVSATIENILVDTGPKGEKSYRAQTSSMRGSVRYENMISINESQYIRLRAGTAEVLLVDPFDSQNVVFYKFCAYHPI